MKNRLSMLILLLMTSFVSGCVGIGGEQIALRHDKLNSVTQKYNEELNLNKSANDLRTESRIGRATFTVFAITTGSITTTSDVKVQVVEQVKEALESLGYRVNLSESGVLSSASSKFSLQVDIKEFWFSNYNWFYPIVPTSGDIQMTLTLSNSEGKKIFEKSYSGSGRSYCLSGQCGFGNATTTAMTEVLNKIIVDFSGNEIRQYISSKEAHEKL